MAQSTKMLNIFRLTTFIGFLAHQVTSQRNDCDNTSFSGREGVISSPRFPLSYPHNLSCTYFIDVGRNNSVLLKFLQFDLEPTRLGTFCIGDWLWIACNETDVENLDFKNRLCGTDLPRTSLRFWDCSVVVLWFFADSSISGGGFKIEYTLFDKANDSEGISDLNCGETVFTNSSGVITIPTNPTEFSARVNCTYTITTNYTNSRISIDPQSLRQAQLLDSFADCVTEYIMIDCIPERETELNPNTSIRLCRFTFVIFLFPELELFVFSCRTLKIHLHSFDYVYRGDGIRFTTIDYDDACGTSTFTDPMGSVTSPKFPLEYPHSLNCFYSIAVDRTKSISLEFLSFKLEGRSAVPPSVMDDCSYDWLTVTCSSDDSVRSHPDQSRKYCGDKTLAKPLPLRYSNCDSLTLNFVTDHSVSHGGFRIRYTITSRDAPYVGCGNTSFAGSSGIMSSPLFPLSYPNDLNCIYSIDVNRSQTVVLRFDSFNIEGTAHVTYLDNCVHDWLMISCSTNGSAFDDSENGDYAYADSEYDDYAYRASYRNTKYCGAKEIPFLLTYSNCDSLTLHFVTDSSVTSGGFRLQYEIPSADCGNAGFSGSNGVIISPRYPLTYPYNMSCAYSIDAGRNSFALLTFKRFRLEEPNSVGDCADWLMITCNETTKANPSKIRKYCGSIQWTASLRIIDCPSLQLEFVSDASNANTGFLIEYTVIDNSNATEDVGIYEVDCGATLFTHSSGVISLPRNPKNYLTTVNCTYIISTNRSSYIFLLVYFSSAMHLMQSFPDCATDRLTIGCVSEGETAVPNSTMVHCGLERTSLIWTSDSILFEDCRQLRLSILSSNYDNPDTYSIPFSVLGTDELCGETSFSVPSGVIYSRRQPWQYGRSVNCSYTIDSGHVNSVLLTISQLNFAYLGIDDESCSNGWLTITCLVNRTSELHPIADRKLCRLSLLSSTTLKFPACRSVTINYFVNYISFATGFHLGYRIGDYDPECGNLSYAGPTGFITSPQFPLSYPHSLNCLYSITGAESSIISLSFLSFHLEGTSSTTSVDSCCCDWVTVSCLSDETAASNISMSRQYCGVKTSSLKFAFPNCAVVVLSFQSDSSVAGGGFKVRYAVRNAESFCGVRDYGSPSGVIRFPWNDIHVDYGDSIDCNYAINAIEASTISLTVWSISLQGAVERNCQSDSLTITCVNSQTALAHKINHRSCDYLNASTQLTFPSCAAVNVVYHGDSETVGKTFRIEYVITSNVEQVRTTVLPMTSMISATEQVTAKTSCATGCKLSSDATRCECLPGNDTVANAQMSSSGRTVGISLTVILLVAGAICLAAFLLFRRRRMKNGSEMRQQLTEGDVDNTKTGSTLLYRRNEEEDTCRYVPLRPISVDDNQEQLQPCIE